MTDLTLGWTLNGAMAPTYWIKPGATAGAHTKNDLITVPAEATAYHTVIVAQSGSGKSFFLGRLIEEIILQTRSRVVILDPNGDYRRLRDIGPEWWWTSAQYNSDTSGGRLPHEPSRKDFEARWSSMDIQVRSGPYSAPKNSKPMRISWSTFPIAFLAENLDSIARSQVYHCHEFVKSVALLESAKNRRLTTAGEAQAPAQPQHKYPLDKARKLLQRARHEGARETLDEEFPPNKSIRRILPRLRITGLAQARDRAASAVEFISPEIERFYFGRAKEYMAEGIVANEIQNEVAERNRARVIDLPSFRDSRTQHVVLSSVVESIWDRAHQDWAFAFEKEADKDERVPVFIVLEEAHNIIPTKTYSVSAEALREQFRTIAAEGRKYGVFLILCTQRPDKLDATIVSECENRALMKLGAQSVLERAKSLLGLENVPDQKLQKCLAFQTGRFLLAGPWAGEDPKFGYSAMRRTVEGGRNLRPNHWATHEDPAPVMPMSDGGGIDSGPNAEQEEQREEKREEKRFQPNGDA